MFDVDRLVEDCRAGLRQSSPEVAIQEVVGRAMARPDDVERALGAPTMGQIATLHHSAELTILNVIWAPGMTIYPHDHRMWAVIGLYGGREDNVFYRRMARGIEPAGGRQIEAGGVTLLGPSIIHAVTNPLRQFTGAIHVYGGDFFGVARGVSGTRRRSRSIPTTWRTRDRCSRTPTTAGWRRPRPRARRDASRRDPRRSGPRRDAGRSGAPGARLGRPHADRRDGALHALAEETDVGDARRAAPTIGATQNSHSCSSAQPPTNSAGPVLRAGFTEVLVTGMLTRWMSVSAEADGERREARPARADRSRPG